MTGLSNWGLAFVFNKMTHPPGGGKSVCGRKWTQINPLFEPSMWMRHSDRTGNVP